MLIPALILLLLIPFIDLYLLVMVAGEIGFLQTLAIVVVTGFVGAGIVKREGVNVLRKLQAAVTPEEISRNVIEGALLVVGGFMLLTPGLVTDFLGLMCAWRPTRERIMLKMADKVKSNIRFEVQTF
ncbi:MAG: FxsA family protein [Candidatus Nanohaloarchaea archaeon]